MIQFFFFFLCVCVQTQPPQNAPSCCNETVGEYYDVDEFWETGNKVPKTGRNGNNMMLSCRPKVSYPRNIPPVIFFQYLANFNASQE